MIFSTTENSFGMREFKRRTHLLLGALTIFTLVITIMQPINKAVAADICTNNGTVTTLSDPAGIGLISSVDGASVLDRTSAANLVSNGDFTTEPAGLSTEIYYWGPTGTNQKYTAAINTGIPQWNRSGGGTRTYAIWTKRNPSPSSPSLINPPANGQSNGRVYFGNGIVDSYSQAPQYNSAGFSTAQYTINPGPDYGTSSTPPAIDQTVTLTPGTTYRLHFSQGTEGMTGAFGVAALEISGYDRVYFRVEEGNKEFYLQFVATTAQTNIKFLSWGHLVNQIVLGPDITVTQMQRTSRGDVTLTTSSAHGLNYPNDIKVSGVGAGFDIDSAQVQAFDTTATTLTYHAAAGSTVSATAAPAGAVINKIISTGAGVLSTELVLDDVIINSCISGPPPAPTAVNDAITTDWDTDQTYSPAANDAAGSGTTLDTASIKLCPTSATSPYNASNCSLSSVTVAGQGVYTLSGSNVIFNPDATFHGVVSTPVRYVIADALGQYASAVITPTIGPKATPDVLTLNPGATASFRTITGTSGLATGAALNTAGTFLCGSGESAPTCTATTVTVSGVGVYTLNQSTGIVTLVADAGATTGQKASLTYVVLDSTGLKASSTLTPTIIVPTPLPTAVNDALTTAWDTDQSYLPLANDSAHASTSLNTSSLKLCPVGAAAPYNASNCSLSSVTVTGQGVYTLSGTTVTFNPDATFFGVASTPVRYVIADALGQYANALITPTIGPKATPDVLTLAAGTTASFRTITGNNGIAAGAALNTLGTYLCGTGETAPNCTETATVTVAGVGVYTLNRSTGVVTLVANANATVGTKAALTYVVTDSTGLTASSTLTPTIYVPTPLPVAVNDAQTSPWDTNQIYSPMGNDSSDTSTALSSINFKLCPTGATSPFNATNCSLTTLTIAGQGVYTLSGTTVTFNPDATFFGVATPIRYVVSDALGQFASATITPTIGPKATPDTLSLAAGATASFRTITGNNGIATGAALNTLATYLCGTNQIAPNCTETATVTVAGVGVYTLNQATGVVTLVADANATAGTKASLTYVVTDSTGMTASSTLTPTIPAPPAPTPVAPAPVPVPEPTPPPLSVATPDTTSDFKGKVHSINLLTNDKPGTGLTLDALTLKFCALTETVPNCTATSVTITGQGTYAVGAGGVVTFTPEANFVGTATALPYVVKDSYGRTINSTYTPIVRDVPSASPDNSSGPFQQVQTLSILGNDKASAGATLVATTVKLCSLTQTPPDCTATSVTIENQGVFLLGADGVVTFTPTKTFTGTATTIKYQVADSSGQIASSTITVIVGPPPLPPKAIDDFRTTPMNVAVSLDPTPNDIAGTFPLVAKSVRLCAANEAIGQCTSTSVTNATGTFTVNTATGIVTFTPKAGWTGVTKVPYIVLDTFGLIAPAYITVTIVPPAYLKLKELAWTGPRVIGPAKKKLVIPTSSVGNGNRIATMRIPRLGSNWKQSVLHGIGEGNLKKDLGYYPGSALPGAIGNFAVAGHRMTQEQPFRDLDKLVAGDPIVVQVGKKIYVYTVVKSKIAKPTDLREIYPVPGNPNAIATKAMLTLTTCHPKNSAKERLVVNAVLDSVYDLATAPEKYKAKS
jgi:LPXTG-site transpeptidase (sortase) family protein